MNPDQHRLTKVKRRAAIALGPVPSFGLNWRLVDETGGTLASEGLPGELVAKVAWQCRVSDEVVVDVPRAWEEMKRWGWKLIASN
jgi:hypothetical protein